MGISITCDCCNQPIEKAHEVGYLKKCYYGDCCLEEYKIYLKEVDDYHTKVSEDVHKKLKSIRDEWLQSHDKAILPDGD